MNKPHVRNLRIGRYSEPGRIYSITTVVQNHLPVFNELGNGRIVVNCMRYQQHQGHADTLAFVVMPDHLHWLLQLRHSVTLSKLLQSLKQFTAGRIYRHLKRVGTPLWQEGYYDHALRKEEDIAQAARYIVENPLRAGLVDNLGDYPLWDSIYEFY